MAERSWGFYRRVVQIGLCLHGGTDAEGRDGMAAARGNVARIGRFRGGGLARKQGDRVARNAAGSAG